jgi:5-methylcytosine-specific restriction endonuclease McrA
VHTKATVVDHVVPHAGNPVKFWDAHNWQPVCSQCHGTVKRELEKRWRRGLLTDADLRLYSAAAVRLTRLYHRPKISVTGEPIAGT